MAQQVMSSRRLVVPVDHHDLHVDLLCRVLLELELGLLDGLALLRDQVDHFREQLRSIGAGCDHFLGLLEVGRELRDLRQHRQALVVFVFSPKAEQLLQCLDQRLVRLQLQGDCLPFEVP